MKPVEQTTTAAAPTPSSPSTGLQQQSKHGKTHRTRRPQATDALTLELAA
jgi:hypothetical protein